MNHNGSIWLNPLACQRLRELWGEGFSALQIADAMNLEFGSALTRNAVIGRAHRSYLEPRAKRKTAQMSLSLRRPRKKPSTPAPKKPDASKPDASKPDASKPDAPKLPDAPKPSSVAAAVGCGCKWPMGTNLLLEGFYCDALIVRGSYCAVHARKAYITPKSSADGKRPLYLLWR